MVDIFNNTLSSALNTAAPLKVRERSTDRISPRLNNNSLNEIKTICQAAERKWRKTRHVFDSVSSHVLKIRNTSLRNAFKTTGQYPTFHT